MSEKLKTDQKFEPTARQVAMLERAGNFTPLAAELSERTITERRPHNPSDFSFQQIGKYIQEYYKGKRNRSVFYEGRLEEATQGNKVLHLMACKEAREHMAYNSERHSLLFGGKAAEELEQNPEIFDVSALHELAHLRFFGLDQKDQFELNDLFLTDPKLRALLLKFANALYSLTDPSDERIGEHAYLDLQDINSQNNNHIKLADEDQPGLKDGRVLEVDYDGKKREVALGLLVTEMISYLSSLQVGSEAFEKVVDNSKKRRGIDLRYDIIFALYKHIAENPELDNKLKSYGLYKDYSAELLQKLRRFVKENIG